MKEVFEFVDDPKKLRAFLEEGDTPKRRFEVQLHENDAEHVVRLAVCCGVEVQDFLAIAAVRYVDLVERGIDAPGRCGDCKGKRESKKGGA